MVPPNRAGAGRALACAALAAALARAAAANPTAAPGGEPPAPPCHCDDLARLWSARWWLNVGLALSCVALAALAAGLTMGLVAIEPFRLQILVRLATASGVGTTAGSRVCADVGRRQGRQ
jgi:hypothetical protein